MIDRPADDREWRHGGQISARPFGYVSRTLDTKPEASGTLHIGPMGVFNGAANYDVSYTSLAGGSSGFFN